MIELTNQFSIALAVGLFLKSTPPTPPSPTLLQPSFLDWCESRDRLSQPERHTVDVLLETAASTDCQIAHEYLSQKITLDLSDRQLSSLHPLASLTQLQSLYLGQNEITDLNPLVSLNQLTDLYLFENNITDIHTISSLQNLKILSLDNNKVQDLSPLSELNELTILFLNYNEFFTLDPIKELPNLSELYVNHNEIVDLSSMRSLSQLTHLNLGANQITDVDDLAKLNQLQELSLNNNAITAVDELASLAQLTHLDLRNNPIGVKQCPVVPITICAFSDDAAEVFNRGQNYLDTGAFEAALVAFETTLQVYQSNGDRLRQISALERIGAAYDALGQYANALDAYQAGLTLAEDNGDRQGESELLAYLGQTYIRLGQFDRAIATLGEASAIYGNLGDEERDWRRPDPPIGLIFNNLALAYSKTENFSPALRFAKYSLAHYRERGNRAGEAIALNRVGQAYLNLGNLNKAQHYFEKALDRTQAWNDQPGQARSLHSLGDLAAHQGKGGDAIAYYQEAQVFWNALQQPAAEGETLNAIGLVQIEAGQLTEAATTLHQTLDLWEGLPAGLTDTDKISITDLQSHTYRLLQQTLVALEDIPAALEISERGRARAFTELLAHRLSLRGESLRGTSWRGQPLPRQSAPTAPIQAPSIDRIKAVAQEQNITLVEYTHHGNELYSWVIQPSGMIHFHAESLQGKPLEEWVTETRQALGVQGRGFTFELRETAQLDHHLHALHEVLIAPIAPLLPSDTDTPVLIIPQGDLFMVPFAALTDETGIPLIEHHPLLFAPAISLLTQTPTQVSASPLDLGHDTALVVGNPLMPVLPSTGTRLNPLAGAEQEVKAIEPILNTVPLIGAAATKAAVLEELETVAIAHFATHGLLDDFGTDMPGALALTPVEPAEDDQDRQPSKFAGELSGFLTATEISTLPLQAQLVVLSACDTGGGRITGDGVLGLSRSFLTAGVDNVVVSLWSVDDASTADLMKAFYDALQQNSNPAIALRQAMLITRTAYPHPSYWAAFTVFGQNSDGQ
ncbi:MAG: CHAT domain-containing protein [Merismopedia sp. SIO2A8]|nr:CHAT domain-containing protein [Merismopedia sp. SIO2A8]